MEKEALIKKLQWFYFLELNQVNLYLAQSREVDDFYLKQALSRIADVEQRHVENIKAKLAQLGGAPSLTGERIAPISGSMGGLVTAKAGTIAILKANIDLEEKAMKDYKDFILHVGRHDDLFEMLWDHLIDEDLHTAWFSNKVKELEEIMAKKKQDREKQP